MQDILSMIDRLKRPALLIRAARHGADTYDRARHLQRLMGYGQVPRTGDALLRLMQDEASINEKRITGDAGYSVVRHLDLLIAMVGESRVLRASQASRATQG
jgi:hypothetical protein